LVLCSIDHFKLLLYWPKDWEAFLIPQGGGSKFEVRKAFLMMLLNRGAHGHNDDDDDDS
jgi:hypothetical protein